MAKHARKKQKTSQNAQYTDPISNKTARLELLLDDESKDDEERRLESLLFGVKYVPKEKGKRQMQSASDDDNEAIDDMEGGGRGMQHLFDHDLFFVDDGPVASSDFELAPNDFSEVSGPDVEDTSDSGSDSESSSESSSSSTSSKNIKPSKFRPKSLTSSQLKHPAWIDPSDNTSATRVSLLSGPTRLRKLRQAVDEDEITGRDYETRLRAHFERINPEPSWARKARGAKGKERKGDEEARGDESEDGMEQEGDGVRELLSSTTGILAEPKKKGQKNVVLPHGTLAIERVRDANHSVQGSGSGEVRVLAFHPRPAVPVLCVATADRRIRLFNIDGHLSPLLTTLHVPSLPLVSNTSVLFHPQGNSLLLSGPRPFFYTYDLQQGTSTLHQRGLWGTGFDDSSILSPSITGNKKGANSKRRRRGGDTSGGGGKGGGGNTENILHTAFSPAGGSLLAVAGRGGNVHIVDWKSGAGQVIGSLKCSSSGGGGGGGVKGLWWVPSNGTGGALGSNASVGHDEKHLAVLTGEAEVFIWDVGQRRCVKKWKDEGGYRGAGRAFTGGAGANGYMAIGSSSGFVNVYGSDSFTVSGGDSMSSSFAAENPKLVKALGHLTTPISTLRFNHDAQILAMASKDKKDSMRLVHLPSLTAFGNWPTSSTPLGHVTAVDFSAHSEYVAIGNTRGKVLLYHLKDYGAGAGAGFNGF
ncbi:hypothetical protein GALMADRAFT_132340 [Galerina marginata CBS 339.88]|uniref:Uncharacterized protein n=1 Tax=Galerina marginata (strain CBS 339.88) TaxID=685588 RepID=A0A067TR62_GALM3|nr:hypothetical protein GALMADRAFT_132340 [Galerina marginata CBS 339.88]